MPERKKSGVEPKKQAPAAQKQRQPSKIPIATIVRIAKEAGAERVGEDAAFALNEIAIEHIKKVVRKGIDFAGAAKRKTLKAEDVALAVKQ